MNSRLQTMLKQPERTVKIHQKTEHLLTDLSDQDLDALELDALTAQRRGHVHARDLRGIRGQRADPGAEAQPARITPEPRPAVAALLIDAARVARGVDVTRVFQ